MVNLAIADIDKNPFQTRYVQDDDALEELAESIKANGVVQPIMVRPSEDEEGRGTMTEAVRALGVEVSEPEPGTVRIGGRGLRGLVPPEAPIDCGNAGTVLRLLSGILAGQDGRFELVGDESLSSRPVRVDEPLRRMGARVETNEGRPPVTIEGARLQPIRYELPVASAQLKSAVLLAGLLAEDGPHGAPVSLAGPAADPRGNRDPCLAGGADPAALTRHPGRFLLRGAVHRRRNPALGLEPPNP